MAKACIVFVNEMTAAATAVGQRLEAQGYEVCFNEVDLDVARAAKAGDLVGAPVEDCIRTADVVVILLPTKSSEMFGGIAAAAVACGTRVVAVGEGSNLPESIDELADSFVAADSENFEKALSQNVWESDAGHRDIARIKCQ